MNEFIHSFPLPFATHDDARIDDGFDETRSRRTPDVGGSFDIGRRRRGGWKSVESNSFSESRTR